MVVLTAINLVQQDIVLDESVDTTLSQRQSLPDTKRLSGFSNEIRSWVVLQQEAEIPDQDLKVGLALHGVIDYILGVVSAKQVEIKSHMCQYSPRYLISISCSQINFLARNSITRHLLNKPLAKDSEGQVLVQGAALCVLSKRPAVMNILTNGLNWVFYKISEVPDAGAAGKPFKASKTRTLSVLEPEELPVILRLLKTSILSSPGAFEILAAAAKT
ncbi:hypothetical protein B0H10DRAFT_1381540 [Mycena sp. CBHHK59/15]|nr:hypothetical protein B0H10DRAFT_1381540 [Mycena sp. CBHHK59/15]